MAVVVVNTESGLVEVTSRKQAERMILTTATTIMCEPDELKVIQDILLLCHVFKIDLNKLTRKLSDDEDSVKYDYPYEYYFEQ